MAIKVQEPVQEHSIVQPKPQGPKGNWLLGNMGKMAQDPLGVFEDAPQYGRLPRFRFLNLRAWLAIYPEDVKHVLVDNQRNYIKGYGLQALKPVLGEGLLTSEPPLHTHQRRIIQPAFHRQRIAAYASVMTEHTSAMLDGWRAQELSGETFDLHEEMMQLTMLIVAQCLFDADVSASAENLGEAIGSLVDAFNTNRIGPVGMFIDRFDRKRQAERKRNRGVLDAMLLGLIRERRAEGVDHGDLLSMILASPSDEVDADGTPLGMSDEQARDELITLFIAGHETTAIAMSWCFYLLAKHPEVEARLLAEVESVLGKYGEEGSRLPTLADMDQLSYTRQVFAETLRIYPPAYATARIALADDVVGGFPIKKGDTVIVSQYVTHRDERWWQDPMRFDPDRFTPEAEAARPKFAYFPFGGGARRCVGESFAWMEGVLILATMIQRVHLELKPDFEPGYHPRVTLRPAHGMQMTARLRE